MKQVWPQGKKREREGWVEDLRLPWSKKGSARLLESQSHHQKIPVSPRSGPALEFLLYCHWLGAACGKPGLGTNVMMDFRAQELGPPSTYTPSIWRSGRHILSHSQRDRDGLCQQREKDPNRLPGHSEHYFSLFQNLKAGPEGDRVKGPGCAMGFYLFHSLVCKICYV